MRASPPLLSSLPPTIRAILSQSASTAANTSSSSSEQATVRGWVKSVRAHKNVSFAAISDGSTSENLQAVFKGANALSEERFTVGSSVELVGQIGQSRGKGQSTEMHVQQTTILGQCDAAAYPIQKKHLPEHFLRDQAHLRFRTTQTAATMRARDAIMRDWHDWFEDNEFVYIHTPALTSSDCEGAGETFSLTNCGKPSTPPLPNSPPPFFPRPTNLTVSSQLHLECATHALSRTYTLSPSFRAEPSMTSRHLAEFYMFEGEVASVTRLDQLLDIVEASIRGTLDRLINGQTPRAERTRRDLEAIAIAQTPEGKVAPSIVPVRQDLVDVVSKPFTRLTYTAAVDLLVAQHAEVSFKSAPTWGHGLSAEHERWLAELHAGPVFVTHYPASLKPFYMLPSAATPDHVDQGQGDTVACFDLLLPGLGELVGGSLREHRLDMLEQTMTNHGLKKEDYEWYLDLRRYGSVPHGGWGMGWERWISYVTGVGNVRDVVAFPRWMGHCKY